MTYIDTRTQRAVNERFFATHSKADDRSLFQAAGRSRKHPRGPVPHVRSARVRAYDDTFQSEGHMTGHSEAYYSKVRQRAYDDRA